MYDAETAGYLAKAAFLRSVGLGAGVGAVAGGLTGALNNDGKSSLGSRVMHGAIGGAVGGAALGALPHAYDKGNAAMHAFQNKAIPTAHFTGPHGMTHIEKGIVSTIGGIVGGATTTGGES